MSVSELLKSLMSDELIKAYAVTPIAHAWSAKIVSLYNVDIRIQKCWHIVGTNASGVLSHGI